MNKQSKKWGSRDGMTMVVVMGLILLSAVASSSVLLGVGSRARLAGKQVDLEQAFFLAEAGAERAAAYIALGNEVTTTLTSDLGYGGYAASIVCQPQINGVVEINVTSVGTVGGVSRTVILHGLHQVSWARYALWYDEEVTKLWIVPGEKFRGRVYSRPQFHFHDNELATKGQVHFFDRVWSVEKTIEIASNAVKPIFDRGIILGASIESMASIDFNDLLAKANAGGLVLEGETEIALNGQTMTVTNDRKNWKSKAVAIPANGLVYAKTVTVKVDGEKKTYTGNISIKAPKGLGSRLTLVSDEDITITDHVRYRNNPQTVPTSTDALGLIAQKNVVVGTTSPKDLEVYAHIICKEGGFGVKNYDTRSGLGTLTVYGGIVNQIRKAVGTTGSKGYLKNYIFDERFMKNPPPNYPALEEELEWSEWEG